VSNEEREQRAVEEKKVALTCDDSHMHNADEGGSDGGYRGGGISSLHFK
jgi:hypothetical protein|tara:strand:+ start:1349 stop:1495 length:147 start_codon:yes stop_codon:yes gene_type:complete